MQLNSRLIFYFFLFFSISLDCLSQGGSVRVSNIHGFPNIFIGHITFFIIVDRRHTPILFLCFVPKIDKKNVKKCIVFGSVFECLHSISPSHYNRFALLQHVTCLHVQPRLMATDVSWERWGMRMNTIEWERERRGERESNDLNRWQTCQHLNLNDIVDCRPKIRKKHPNRLAHHPYWNRYVHMRSLKLIEPSAWPLDDLRFNLFWSSRATAVASIVTAQIDRDPAHTSIVMTSNCNTECCTDSC